MCECGKLEVLLLKPQEDWNDFYSSAQLLCKPNVELFMRRRWKVVSWSWLHPHVVYTNNEVYCFVTFLVDVRFLVAFKLKSSPFTREYHVRTPAWTVHTSHMVHFLYGKIQPTAKFSRTLGQAALKLGPNYTLGVVQCTVAKI